MITGAEAEATTAREAKELRPPPTPLLMIVADEDFLPIGAARRAFERAGDPKRLVVIPAGHFAPYEAPHFATAAGEAAEWFRRHLRA